MSESTDVYYYNLLSHGSEEYIGCNTRVRPSFLEVSVNVVQTNGVMLLSVCAAALCTLGI